MDAALLIARLVLAGVFTLAGVAKLSDLKGSRQAIIDFGVPSAARWPPRATAAPGRAGRRRYPLCPHLRPGGGLWGRWRSSRCSSWASPSTWPGAASPTATASGSCTPPRLGGRP